MKKLLSSLLAVLMAALALGLSACNDNSTGENSGGNGNLPAEHTHEYAATWSSDETEHWHACTGENCTEVKDKAAHTWNDGEITTPATETADGIKTFTCTVCEKTKTESVEYVPVGGETNVLAGKIFVFYNIISDSMDADMLAGAKAQMQNSTIEFYTDGTFVINQIGISVVQTGTYAEEETGITITIVTMTQNGETIESPSLPMTVQCAFDGEYFSFSTSVGPDITATNIFILE